MPRPGPNDIAMALADALPREASRRDELVAIGMIATALIEGVEAEERAQLVEVFCRTLRKSIAGGMN